MEIKTTLDIRDPQTEAVTQRLKTILTYACIKFIELFLLSFFLFKIWIENQVGYFSKVDSILFFKTTASNFFSAFLIVGVTRADDCVADFAGFYMRCSSWHKPSIYLGLRLVMWECGVQPRTLQDMTGLGIDPLMKTDPQPPIPQRPLN